MSDAAGGSLAKASSTAILLTGSPVSTVSSSLNVTVDSKLVANVAVVISD